MTSLAEIEGLIARMAMGDRKALSALYAATAPKLYGIALRVLGDRGEAEDALQEIFVKLWHNADRYRQNGLSPMTWLITVARNHSIDRLRARRSAPVTQIEAAADLADLSPTPEDAAAAAQLRGRIAECLGTLDPDRADAVRRAYLHGDTYADLARHYGIPLNTVRTWLRRSLIRLRECLGT
ncbi:sigma-70 family RNA polymerase sigma factor [Rubellimicrobium sp. CFH 75288]|uniref:sigma-70 family RNA polymerase sigma factor n=1 Tax=Rubellimicrobium sp. CFH 75288 TaxID=2697034 RepID=UPI0014126B27|nr:sigma-70 family RNA polymerase sigma factor [Rubellimicrobium sp. CFH 75288]NAZ35379.1 sigma-70 family RNA polymerase sigma factor [Rubellimicrobium sp. CFH 75288]